MRFRKRVKILPGVYINFSTSGISTTIGVPGLSLNFNNKGTYLNTGIPGTGIYDRKKLKSTESNKSISPEKGNPEFSYFENLEAISSNKAELTTSSNLDELKKNLLECIQEKKSIKEEIKKARMYLFLSTFWLVTSYVAVVGLFLPWFRKNRRSDLEYLQDLEKQLENCFINIDIEMEKDIDEKYQELLKSYENLINCERIWDVTAAVEVDRKINRSAGSTGIVPKPVKLAFGNSEIIKSRYDALHFENANGGDLYIYPAFIAIYDSHENFGLIDIRDLNFTFEAVGFIETEIVPKDATIDHYTWAKVNKNGTPDKRFKGNYQIPVCTYGNFMFRSKTGLNEAYMFSNIESARGFGCAMEDFQMTFRNLLR